MTRKAMAEDSESSELVPRNSPTRKLPTPAAAAPAAPLLSVDTLEEIFLNLPPDQVVCLCRLVCSQWKEVADRKSFWRKRCRREGYHIRDALKEPRDWRLFYFLCKRRRNLLKNPSGTEELQHWEILKNGGDQWAVHGVRIPVPNTTITTNFVTSFGMCIKSQLIDLEREGYSPEFMDQFQPDIRISDRYSQRSDCGSLYKLSVELLHEEGQPVQVFYPETIYIDNARDEWNLITHVFQNYGPGVRYIRFTHGGKDLRWWKGWYGIRLTDSCVEICPAMDA
ncbi:F-box only protein 44-like [Parambassis ranga]|uniref:F-box only protein 44-like n=1 Tax=Parambassis ranga TaxID=210632 RepID=A0A6P7ICB3_9TELE|nr:F-box only protein 44-like [Parambassis ranga]